MIPSKQKQMWAFIMKRMSLAWKLMQFVYHKSVNWRWATFWDDFCSGHFWYILCVVLHTWNCWDWLICSPVVCLELCICYDVKSWHSVLVLYICSCIHWKTVWEHSAGCELYSSHSETEILAMNVTFKWAERIITDSRRREQ